MWRRLILFVLCPVLLSYGLAMAVQSAGIRTAGLIWLAALFYYVIFGLPGLVIVTNLGRGRRRDWVEMAGLLASMAVGVLAWSTLSYSTSVFVVEAGGPRRYTIFEAALFGFRDAAIDTLLAGVVVATVVLIAKFAETAFRRTPASVA